MHIVVSSSAINFPACGLLIKEVDFLAVQIVSSSLELFWTSESSEILSCF
jgi:hypothetical protein